MAAYKRDERSRYTYVYKCEARAFVNTLATNEFFKSRLIRDMRKVIELLSDPHCELFQPLVIDYDLIEVNDGVCWSVKNRSFVESPIEECQVGKTSLFFPIQGLIHHGNIATVTKQRAFNKAMITPFTEVIFIDEADESALDIADWKNLTQGGYTAHDVKYQTAKAFMNKCPMLVTAQHELNFGATHQPAMDRHLSL